MPGTVLNPTDVSSLSPLHIFGVSVVFILKQKEMMEAIPAG